MIKFHAADGGDQSQAEYVFEKIIPDLRSRGYKLGEIGVLYRWAKHSDTFVSLAESQSVPLVRADNKALIKRNSPISRFIEKCAQWVVVGWKTADPRFERLCRDAVNLVYGGNASEDEKRQIEHELITCLLPLDREESTHTWLLDLKHDLIFPWFNRRRSISEWAAPFEWSNLKVSA